jgi:hypothetical protein
VKWGDAASAMSHGKRRGSAFGQRVFARRLFSRSTRHAGSGSSELGMDGSDHAQRLPLGWPHGEPGAAETPSPEVLTGAAG